MKHIKIKTAAEERDAVMGDYKIEPLETGWTLHERNRHTWEIAEMCSTRRQARALWLQMFDDRIEELRSTDRHILEVEKAFLKV